MRVIKRPIVVIFMLSLFLSVLFVAAQDATSQPTSTGTIVCDSDLMLSLSTAENFFGFSEISGMMTNADPALRADVTSLDFGQYTPLFTASTNAPPIISMTQEQMQGIADMMSMDAAAMQAEITSMLPAGTDLSAGTTLNAAPIAGEDPTCTTLRTELNRFYTILNFQHMQNIGTGAAGTTSGDTAAGVTGTPATPVSGIGGSNSTGSSETGNGGASSGNLPGSGAQLTPPPGGGSPGG